MSYQKISAKIVGAASSNLPLDKDEKDICIYGMEILLSTVINLLLLVLIATIFHLQKEILIYSLFFMPLRLYSGGAHAKTHARCISIYIAFMLMSIWFSSVVVQNVNLNLYIGFMLLLCVLINIFLAAKKKNISDINKIRHHRISIGIIIVSITIISIHLLFFRDTLEYTIIATCGLTIQSLSILPLWCSKISINNRFTKSSSY
ncbi:MAG: agrB [Anaerocolumna sp.]|nr:agrB [Anaerocolumna sp.]